ncbi:MAG TPA: hypothetical protein VED40_11185 [Azospirillaceae bacterium]|nr:hypothetical protein [Azospirillaceae bacterium]
MLLSTAPASPSDEIRITSGTLPEGEVTILPASVDDEVYTILPFPEPGDDSFTFGPGVDAGDEGIVTILPYPLPGDGEVTILPVEVGDEPVFTILPYPLPGEGPAESGFAIEDVGGKPPAGGSLGAAPAEGVTIAYGAVPLEIVQFAGLEDLFASLTWHV